MGIWRPEPHGLNIWALFLSHRKKGERYFPLSLLRKRAVSFPPKIDQAGKET
jgi:hypothetical protein